MARSIGGSAGRSGPPNLTADGAELARPPRPCETMPDKRKAILLRIPADLWAELNRWAGDELRSLNAQIEYVLRDAVRRRRGHDAEPPAATSEDEKP